jgi:hypothetical protein
VPARSTWPSRDGRGPGARGAGRTAAPRGSADPAARTNPKTAKPPAAPASTSSSPNGPRAPKERKKSTARLPDAWDLAAVRHAEVNVLPLRSGIYAKGCAVYRLYVPERPPSLNEILRKYRNRHAYKNLKTRWAGLIRYHALSQTILAANALKGPRLVSFTRVLGPGERAYDDDNLEGGLKPIRDVMCRGTLKSPGLGLILDDRKEAAAFQYDQVRGERSALVIDLEDLPCPG